MCCIYLRRGLEFRAVVFLMEIPSNLNGMIDPEGWWKAKVRGHCWNRQINEKSTPLQPKLMSLATLFQYFWLILSPKANTSQKTRQGAEGFGKYTEVT